MEASLTPTAGHGRLLPPSRTKRLSQARTRASTSSPSPSSNPQTSDEVDDRRGKRTELEDAQSEKWVECERLQERIQELEEKEKRCQADKEDIRRGIEALQTRCEEAFREQSRLEADVEARDELLDRLRSRSAMLEREMRESRKISQLQERTFEAERNAFQTQEAQLQSRIRQLQSAASSSKTPSSTSTSSSEILQEDLDSLRMSHATLLAQLDRSSNEVQELRSENVRLKEENEGWEYLVREQTFSNRLFQREKGQDDRSDGESEYEATRHRTQLDVLDEELDEEMVDLHSDLKAQSPTMDGPILPRSTPTSRQPSGRMRMRNTSVTSTAFTEEPSQGMDLAAELGRAGLGQVDEPADETAAENKKLREEVKALQLYCSKIIDRIIAQDGFEHILNVDYKTRRVGRSASGGRGSLQDVVKMMQGNSAPVPPPLLETVSTPDARPVRPVSMARGDSEVATITSPTPDPGARQETLTKRARRGFSLDLRSFGFGHSTPEPKPPLKPLMLNPSPALTAHSKPPGRKLEPQAEDDEDRRERSRLEAALKLMGIDKPSTPQSTSASIPEVQGVKRSSSVKASGTPLSRLSNALGFADSQLPADPDPTPEKVDVALKEYDQKERARRSSRSTGKAEVGYTSPPRPVRRMTESGQGQMRESASVSTLWSVGDDSPDRHAT